ncbi:kinase-like domain-containing protein [Aspergillus bertholletiae]|uniref:Kinase-like domain-containing protein n=1 Tax=Aspergillus bertholletiae TaxID=1226010 RepID=A0A5N7BME1_9EURO|nr:kinase-like domain-containing protein [Aspergillus bertholletiae]
MSRVRKSKAARFNAHVLKKLQTAVAMDPELDLTTQLPSAYSGRLGKMRETVQSVDDITINTTSRDEEDIRTTFNASIQAEIVHPLSQEVLELLSPGDTKVSPVRLSQRLLDIMRTSEVIWKAPFARQKMVLKCGNNIVLKVIRNMDDYTEYTTLQYLRQHRPNVPVPEPSGLVRVNDISLVFMTHVSSNMLADVWSILNSSQKASIKEQLAAILLDLRSIPFTPGTPLGGVGGEGCKDIRRHLRRSEAPILSASDFEDFLYTGSHEGGQVFVELLRQLAPPISAPSSPAIVFTHGDLRPNNIAVTMKDDTWVIVGLIDWEYSGFYPEYYEAVRCTNCLAPYEDNDWFLFLPDCVSPKAYAHWWLLDRVRETRLV